MTMWGRDSLSFFTLLHPPHAELAEHELIASLKMAFPHRLAFSLAKILR